MTETSLDAPAATVEIEVNTTEERKGRETLLAKSTLNSLVIDPDFDDGDTIVRGQE